MERRIMSRPRKRIRRMYRLAMLNDAIVDAPREGDRDWLNQPIRLPNADYDPVLVIPDNDTARRAMIDRTVSTLWPDLDAEAREERSLFVGQVIGTALTPS